MDSFIYKLISEATHEKWINLCFLQHQHLADIIMNGYIFYTFLEILNGIGSEYIFHWICWKALNYIERTSSYVQIIIKWDAHWIKLKHMVWLLNVSIYDSFNQEKNTIFLKINGTNWMEFSVQFIWDVYLNVFFSNE